MSDDDAALDSMDTEEDIFSPRNRSLGSNARRVKSLRTLRSHSNSTSHISMNNLSVRRSTRHRMQTYDNLNTSWILGKAYLKIILDSICNIYHLHLIFLNHIKKIIEYYVTYKAYLLNNVLDKIVVR